MTTGGHAYPWRIACRFQSRSGFVVPINFERSTANVWSNAWAEINRYMTAAVLEALQEMFAE